MSDFEFFPSQRTYLDYPGWVWFAGIQSIVGGIIAGCLVLYLLSIHFNMGGILFYLLVSILLPACGHGVLNFRKWAKSLLVLLTSLIIVVTLVSGIYGIAFSAIGAEGSVSRGILDVAVLYGWLASNAYVLLRLVMDRGDKSPFNFAPKKKGGANASVGPIYYYVFLILWYGIIFLALLNHIGVVSLPLWSV